MPMEDLFAERIARLRKQKGVTARDMSLSLGQGVNYINTIENGKAYPKMESFFYICDYLGITPGEFFDVENEFPAHLSNLLATLKTLSLEDLELIALVAERLTDK